jgi:hypothetical protein
MDDPINKEVSYFMSNSNLIYNNDPIYNDPLAFIDTLDSNKHLVLFYKNQEFGQKIQFRFIQNGLLKGESCIYTTHDNDISFIENQMMKYEIDVEKFYKKGLLLIYKIPDLSKHPSGIIKGAKEIISRMLSGPKSPFRLVIRLIDEIDTKEQLEANMALERIYHNNIDKYPIYYCVIMMLTKSNTIHITYGLKVF